MAAVLHMKEGRWQVEKAFCQELFQDSARAKRDGFIAGAITMAGVGR